MNKDTIWILDNGHGGMINGVYQTAGKRSPEFDKGVLYEGVSNRDLVKRIAKQFDTLGIKYKILVPEQKDISLSQRVLRANKIWLNNNRNACLISVHSDAFSKESANGWSVFTSVGETKSDKVATALFNEAKKMFPKEKMRPDNSDGDPDKEAHFYILKKTFCPAVLTENFFMTNKKNYDLLNTESERQKLAMLHVKAVQKLIK